MKRRWLRSTPSATSSPTAAAAPMSRSSRSASARPTTAGRSSPAPTAASPRWPTSRARPSAALTRSAPPAGSCRRITLRANGIDPDTDLTIVDAGGHPQVVTAVLNGDCDAGATFVDARTDDQKAGHRGHRTKLRRFPTTPSASSRTFDGRHAADRSPTALLDIAADPGQRPASDRHLQLGRSCRGAGRLLRRLPPAVGRRRGQDSGIGTVTSSSISMRKGGCFKHAPVCNMLASNDA